jgi:hypothetical protein
MPRRFPNEFSFGVEASIFLYTEKYKRLGHRIVLFVTQTTEKNVKNDRTFNSIGKTLDTSVFPVCLKIDQFVSIVFSIKSNASIRCDNFLDSLEHKRYFSLTQAF